MLHITNDITNYRKTIFTFCWLLLLSLQSFAISPDFVVKTLGNDRGICVVLGENTAEFAIRLARSSELILYVQSPDEQDVLSTRQRVDAVALLGTRIYVEKGSNATIHLASNLADVIVVMTKDAIDQKEILRVLRPGGQWIVNDKVHTKPVPEGIDQWTHPYHGPDNNPLSTDQLAKAPYLTQFLAQPYYGPMPEVTVTAGGKLFKAFGHISFKKREWAMLNKLVAMNAYNGVILWERDLTPGYMIHRNTLIATADTLYLADNDSCKLIDTNTGKIKDEIVISSQEPNADSKGWKWMALKEGVLYALVGDKDVIDKVLYGTKKTAGWPWTGLGKNYAKLGEEYPWGYGRTLLAIDPKTKKVIWSQTETERIDSRAVVLSGNRIFAYSHPHFLAAFNRETGQEIWRTSDPALLDAIGPHDPAQTWTKGYASQVYLSASEGVLYFAGPQRTKLVAVSMDDGHILWDYQDGNMLLVVRDGVIYGMARNGPSKKFNAVTGEIIADLPYLRGNCTRVNGTIDSIFARGDQHGGTLRIDIANDQASRLPAMRPACQDGVIAANGQLYWGPWMCDCNHSLIGIICLSPAGNFNYSQSADEKERLEKSPRFSTLVQPLSLQETDWPTYRKNNQCTSQTTVSVGRGIQKQWEFLPHLGIKRTAPITVDGVTFVGGTDGILYAVDNQTGRSRWQFYTGGQLTYPPCYGEGRLYAGSADGWVYALEASTGDLLWKFRASPVDRKIPVYGTLSSTWPVVSVLVEDGVVYAAAGIASHDGTHVYALDAKTGSILWQNNTSGHLVSESKASGVSVQGHLLLDKDKLYLAGGNVVSPAIYDKSTGQCLNTLTNEWQKAPRGKELFLVNGQVQVFDQMLYSPRGYIPSRYYAKYLLQAGSGSDLVYQGTEKEVMCVNLKKSEKGKAQLVWHRSGFVEIAGVVVANDAVLTVGGITDTNDSETIRNMFVVLNPKDGSPVYRSELPSPVSSWGIAVDRVGRILITTDDGHLLCYRS